MASKHALAEESRHQHVKVLRPTGRHELVRDAMFGLEETSDPASQLRRSFVRQLIDALGRVGRSKQSSNKGRVVRDAEVQGRQIVAVHKGKHQEQDAAKLFIDGLVFSWDAGQCWGQGGLVQAQRRDQWAAPWSSS